MGNVDKGEGSGDEDGPGCFSFRNLGHTSLVRCLLAYSF